MKRTILALSVLAVFAATGFARDGGHFGGLTDSLNLTADQNVSLAELRGDRGVRGVHSERHDRAIVGFGANAFDRAAFVEAQRAQSEERINASADFLAKFHAILTPEQREAFVNGAQRKPRGERPLVEQSRGERIQDKKRPF
jgi:Spy/CpxP family protein refolding chaperone